MRIKQVNTYFLRDQLSHPVEMAQGVTTHRHAGLVEIVTECGISGWGEGLNVPRQSIIDECLIGRDPFEIDLIWRKIGNLGWGAISFLSGIDMALHDLIGKALDRPVYSILCGGARNKVKAYASGLLRKPEFSGNPYLIEEARQYVDMGFRAMKMKVGFEKRGDIENVHAIRSCIGNEVDLAIDANCGYSVEDAIEVGKSLEGCDLLWFEEPANIDDIDGYRRIREEVSMPVAGGELLRGKSAFARLIFGGAVDIVQPDVSICGGISECKKISSLAESNGVQLIPHMWGGILRLAATLQVIAMLPEDSDQKVGVVLEFDMSENPFRTDLSRNQFKLEDGFVKIPDAPGLGVEIDRERVLRYCVRSNLSR